MNMGVLGRLRMFASDYGLTIQRIEKTSGLANGSIAKAEARGSYSDKMIESILDAFPYLSKTWLTTGEGDMFNGDSSAVSNILSFNNNSNNVSSNDDIVSLLKQQLEDKQRTIDNLMRQIDVLTSIIEKQCK